MYTYMYGMEKAVGAARPSQDIACLGHLMVLYGAVPNMRPQMLGIAGLVVVVLVGVLFIRIRIAGSTWSPSGNCLLV